MAGISNRVLPIAFAAILAGCGYDGPSPARRAAATYHADTAGVHPSSDVIVPMRARRELDESSAAAVSDDQPGIVFTINDSGNDPMLFALDTTGADRGAWRVDSADNVDWEAAALGPCAEGDGAQAGRSPNGARCIYIGDTGDNAAMRSTVAIYRVAEPRAGAAGSLGHLPSERLVFSYPDDAHDVEAMYVAPDTSVILVTKRPRTGSEGQLRPALVFRLPPAAWRGAGPAVAELIDSLPIVPGSAPLRTITDAALSADARYLAVRTYAQVFVFAADSVSGRVRHGVSPTVCNIFRADQLEGEGVGWLGGAGMRRLVLTSEGRASPLRIVTCPLPASGESVRR